ncbi:U-box domain-containing protein 21 [Magnolia sinica]|uniref:U-box domain-containing protein 21 n=1 Tax=Magnolia sinica TaxID=86752 RepID=UPI002657D77A|nr:U-box domain-containing protein 21 [Magnolia sinica]
MFRIRKAGRKDGTRPGTNPAVDLAIPAHFRCPISLDLMKDPVTLCTGITYDRQSIDTWIEAGNLTCPVTNQVLRSMDQIPNHTIRRMIQDWCVENRSYGIERIPTPRIPVTTTEVSVILLEITTACRARDDVRCLELVKKINALGKESERNRQCITAIETGRVLSATFDAFATSSMENHVAILEEILLALTWMFPLYDEARIYLGSSASLHCMAWFLKCGSLGGRRATVLAVKDLASSEQRHVNALVGTDGLLEALVKMIKEPICPTTTKASLMTIYYMVSSSSPSSSSPKQKTAERFVELGLVALLLEALVDSEKSICEKALAVLDGICDCDEGRKMAHDHALTVPILVKKIFRVSNMATEFAVSVLWKLSKNCKEEDGGILVEGLLVGAFQKILLLLQVGCGERTKEKATDLLKLLNGYRGRGECIDSMDFKQLKRPF